MPNDDPIARLFRENPPRSSATLGGPTAAAEEMAQQHQTEAMAEGPPQPSIGSVAAQSAGATLGAMAAPETGAAMGVGAVGAAIRTVGAKVAPRLLQAGLQLLERAPGLVTGTAQLATRATGAGLGALGTGEVFSPYGETSEAASLRRREDFTAGLVGEGVGAGLSAASRVAKARLGKLFGRIDPGRRPLLEPGAEAAQARLEQFGGSLLPGQMTTSPGIDILQNIAQASLTGSGTIATAEFERGYLPAMAAIDDAAGKMAQALTPQQAGDMVKTVISKPLEAQKAFVAAAYKNLDNQLANAGSGPLVDIAPVMSDLERVFATRISRKDPDIGKMMRILGDNPTIGFKEADDVRGWLLSMSRSADPQVDPGIKKYAGRVAAQIESQIDQAANRAGAMGRGLKVAMTQARKMRSMQANYFDEQLIGPLLEKASSEEVAGALLQHGNPSQIEAVFKIVNEPKYRKAIGGNALEYWEKIQSAWVRSQRNASGEGAFGGLDGARLGSSIDHSNGTWEALYPEKQFPGKLKTIRASARALEMIQSRPGGVRSGTVVMQMVQGREFGQALKGIPELLAVGASGTALKYGGMEAAPAAGLILLAPYLTAKVLASKSFSRWLMRRALTSETRVGSKAGSAMGQAVSALIEDKIPFTFLDPSGATTTYDPSRGVQGQYAPSGSLKPVSKIRPQ
jgi:hypothetical protein